MQDLVGTRLAPIPGHFTEPVLVEDAEELSAELWQVKVRTISGVLIEDMLSTEDLRRAIDEGGAESGFVSDAEGQLLLTEARRIRLAYAHDPYFAVSMSGIAPYPHQLEAVYEAMLPQARLRFLLADDPGAGKTIMAGLLLKELELRGVLAQVEAPSEPPTHVDPPPVIGVPPIPGGGGAPPPPPPPSKNDYRFTVGANGSEQIMDLLQALFLLQDWASEAFRAHLTVYAKGESPLPETDRAALVEALEQAGVDIQAS